MRYDYRRPRRRHIDAPGTIHRFASGLLLLIVALVSLVVTGVLLASVYYVREYLPAVSTIFWGVLAAIAILSAILGFICLLMLAVSFWVHRVSMMNLDHLEIKARQREIESGHPRILEENHPPEQLVTIPKILHYPLNDAIIRPGQVLMGMRPNDGTLRLGTWDDLKTILVLGQSHSGKTITIITRAVDAVRNGAWLVVCDPHGYKKDSLLQAILPLEPFLLPGSSWAIEHKNILHNVRLVRQILEQRVKGSPATRPVVLIVEEWNRLQRDEEIARELTTIAQTLGQEGRGFGVYGVFGAQQVTGNVALRKSVISAIVHRCDRSEAELVIPARFAKFAPELKTGQTYVRDADGLTEPLQQAMITLPDVERIARTMLQRFPPQVAQLHSTLPPMHPQTLQSSLPLPPMHRQSQIDFANQPTEELFPLTRQFKQSLFHKQQTPQTTGETPETALEEPLVRLLPVAIPPISPNETPQKNPRNVSETVKQQIIDLAKQGKSRRDIQAITGLHGEKYQIIKQVLDDAGL